MTPDSGLLETGSTEDVSLEHVTPKNKKKSNDKPVEKSARENAFKNGIDWYTVGWIGLAHVLALAAPFTFTWQGLVVFAVFSYMTGMVGVTLGYHRLLTHGSFVTYRPVRWLLALIGGLSGEGSALTWVANHRKHHVLSDKPGDPHSPNDGAWWSHMFWFTPKVSGKEYADLTERWAPDLVRDPVIVMLHKLFLPLHITFGASLYGIGYYFWNSEVALSMLIWGMFLRLTYVYHITWFVNSATHMWGYRNYATTDNSRNLWWVGILAFGEGWHNNHHAYQRMAVHGHKWWEIDQTYWVILAMEKLGLAWKVVKEIPHREQPA